MDLKKKAEAKAREYQVADVCQVWNGGCPNVRHASMQMFEWTKQEMIEKAATWFANRYQVQDGYLNSSDIDDFYREMMEE